MDSITIDGQHEDAFRQSIEDMLRRGLADDAALHLRSLLQPFTGEVAPFPARFMAVSHEDIEISGWEALDEGLKKFDRAEQPVTAVCLSFGDPEGRAPKPDGAGLMSLPVETAYFSDEAFPFSESDRNDLLDGYSSFGCQWAGDCEGVDHAIAFRGVDDLYGALAQLEQHLLSSDTPDPDEIRAGTIASCYLSVLFHKALRDSFAKRRLGRPLCVLTANNGVYPSFDAPVLSCDEYLAGGEVVAIAAAAPPPLVAEDSLAPAHVAIDDEETAEEASLLSIGIKRAAKKPVLALAEGEDGASMDEMIASAALGVAPPPPPSQPALGDDPFDYRPYLEPQRPAVEDVFEDPASFVEIAAEAEEELPEPVAKPMAAEEIPADADEPEVTEAVDSAPVEPAQPVVDVAPVVDTAPAEPDAPAPVTSDDTSPTPTAQATIEELIKPRPAALTPEQIKEGYKPWAVTPDNERQMGDTVWPEREENPAVRAEDIAPFEPDLPPPPLPPREFAPQAGHSLRARMISSGEAPAPMPEERPSVWSKLVDRLFALFQRR
ncbi:hypothetical protein [Novosphingobium aquae]|uniref:Uncharacterized protein n=1 Tax=Novosphingobium aquae TaxID=3133435 RepID=A0ABU8S3R7_9SPHN